MMDIRWLSYPDYVKKQIDDSRHLMCRRCGRIKSLPSGQNGGWLPSDESAGGRAG